MMKKNNLSCCSTSKSPVIDDRVTDKKVWALWYNSEIIKLKNIFFEESYFLKNLK